MERHSKEEDVSCAYESQLLNNKYLAVTTYKALEKSSISLKRFYSER
jgi:hypothetical protein